MKGHSYVELETTCFKMLSFFPLSLSLGNIIHQN